MIEIINTKICYKVGIPQLKKINIWGKNTIR